MLKIGSPQQHGQLFPKQNGILNGEVIAKGVQGTTEGEVRFSAIRPVQLLH
jgi:hypothetical protein